MNIDPVGVMFIICGTILILFFAGEPDLMDVIKESIKCKKETEL